MSVTETINNLTIVKTDDSATVIGVDDKSLILVKVDDTFNGPNGSVKVACGDKVSPNDLTIALSDKLEKKNIIAGTGIYFDTVVSEPNNIVINSQGGGVTKEYVDTQDATRIDRYSGPLAEQSVVITSTDGNYWLDKEYTTNKKRLFILKDITFPTLKVWCPGSNEYMNAYYIVSEQDIPVIFDTWFNIWMSSVTITIEPRKKYKVTFTTTHGVNIAEINTFPDLQKRLLNVPDSFPTPNCNSNELFCVSHDYANNGGWRDIYLLFQETAHKNHTHVMSQVSDLAPQLENYPLKDLSNSTNPHLVSYAVWGAWNKLTSWGHMRLKSGLLINFGTIATTGTSTNVTFHTPFVNENYTIMSCRCLSNSDTSGIDSSFSPAWTANGSSKTSTYCRISTTSGSENYVSWIAIGY